jgi:hypothetical protein
VINRIKDIMIDKVISGGQTGVDRAALDAAIALGIPYGGWLPKGRRTEEGPLPLNYQLQEMDSVTYKDRTIQNVMDSDGTLLIARGALTGGSAVTLHATKAYQKPCLLINLNNTPIFLAATRIVDWLLKYNIKVLNVAGPRASKAPTIYTETRKIIESVYYLSMIKINPSDPAGRTSIPTDLPPATVADALNQVISGMALKDRVMMANMTESEVLLLDSTLGRYLSEKINLWCRNPAFTESYKLFTGNKFEPVEASNVLLLELWRTLKITHKLRVIK